MPAIDTKALAKTAWDKTLGEKSTLWNVALSSSLLSVLPLLIFTIAALLFPHTIIYALIESAKNHLGTSILLGFLIILAFIVYFFMMSLLATSISFMALRFLRGEKIHASMMFESWQYKKALLFNFIIFIIIGSLVSSYHINIDAIRHGHVGVPSLWLMIADVYVASIITFVNQLAYLYIFDRGQGGVQAFIIAWKLFFRYWQAILVLSIWILLLRIFSVMTLGIASIWTMPAIHNMYALLHDMILMDTATP